MQHSEIGIMAATLWFVSSSIVAAGPVGLRLNIVTNLEQSYADHGSGASMNLFTWQPSCSPATHAPMCDETWMSLGHVATSSVASPGTAIVALAGPGDPLALAKPTSLSLNWNSLLGGKSKGTSGGMYTPVCPSGYAALGSVAIKHDISKSHEITPALFPNLRCVKKKYLKVGGQLRLLWDSKPTHFDTPCSVWTQPQEVYQHHPDDVMLTLPMLGGQQSFDAPTNASFQIDIAAGVDVIVPPPPPCGPPPLAACPPCGDQGTGLPPCICPAPKRGSLPPCAVRRAPTCEPPHCDASRFLGSDNTTQGDWQSKYGKSGQVMFGLGGFNGSENLPPFVRSVSILAADDAGSPAPSPAPCPSIAPGFTNCSAMSFEDMCIAADTPGCCHWCKSPASNTGRAGVCLPRSEDCSAVLPFPPPPRRGRWSAMPTAMDPRALSFPTPGVYKSLGFVATSSPQSANATFEIAIDLTDAAQEYILWVSRVQIVHCDSRNLSCGLVKLLIHPMTDYATPCWIAGRYMLWTSKEMPARVGCLLPAASRFTPQQTARVVRRECRASRSWIDLVTN